MIRSAQTTAMILVSFMFVSLWKGSNGWLLWHLSAPALTAKWRYRGRLAPTMSSTSLGSYFGLETEAIYPQRTPRTDRDPEQFIQDYIEDPHTPEPRDHINGTVLVSGLVQHAQANDQAVFDLLNQELSSFSFDHILAFVDNIAAARKQLLSRSARYTGLLDKLRFVQANTTGGLPTHDQLAHVTSWVAYVEGKHLLRCLEEVTTIAKGVPSLHNLVVLMADAVGLSEADSSAFVQKMEATGKSFTLVAVGVVKDEPEGLSPYKYIDLKMATDDDLPTHAVFSRNEAFRLAIDSLQLNSAVNQSFYFQEVTPEHKDAKLIRGLREAGYTRTQEIDYMIRGGPQKYEKHILDFQKGTPETSSLRSNYTGDEQTFIIREDTEMLAKLLPDRFWEQEGWNETNLWKDFRHADVHRIARDIASGYYEDARRNGELELVTESEFYKATHEATLALATRLHEQNIKQFIASKDLSQRKSKSQRHKELITAKRIKQKIQQTANQLLNETEFDMFWEEWCSGEEYIPRDVPYEEAMKFMTRTPKDKLEPVYETPDKFDPDIFNLDDHDDRDVRNDYDNFTEPGPEFFERLEKYRRDNRNDDDDDIDVDDETLDTE